MTQDAGVTLIERLLSFEELEIDFGPGVRVEPHPAAETATRARPAA